MDFKEKIKEAAEDVKEDVYKRQSSSGTAEKANTTLMKLKPTT